MIDVFGERMKSYESQETSRKFIPMLPVYARIDGRGFSKFTKGLNRPYDLDFTSWMIHTTKHLVKETNAKIGYTQSDEISLVWCSDTYDGEIFFTGKIQKMVSVLASMATAAFTQAVMLSDKMEWASRMPHFDARVFSLPNKIEATNALLWRETDAFKNAISSAAHHYFSHNSLQNKSGPEMQEMLFSQAGINFNDYPRYFKRGTFIRREVVERTLSIEELAKIPEKHRPEPNSLHTRSQIVCMDMPKFSSVTNRVEVVFDGANPVVS